MPAAGIRAEVLRNHTVMEVGVMLVLSRKADEAICIDENIKLYVLSVQGKKVKVGIEAPPDVHILRGELCERVPLARKPPELAACGG